MGRGSPNKTALDVGYITRQFGLRGLGIGKSETAQQIDRDGPRHATGAVLPDYVGPQT
jgi:hypothetical protein